MTNGQVRERAVRSERAPSFAGGFSCKNKRYKMLLFEVHVNDFLVL